MFRLASCKVFISIMLQYIASKYTTKLKEDASKKESPPQRERAPPAGVTKRRLSDTTLPSTSALSETAGVQEVALSSCMKRSRSHNGRLNVKFSDPEESRVYNTNNTNSLSSGAAALPDVTTEVTSARTLDECKLMSNSTVSLQSMRLNAEFMADLQQAEQTSGAQVDNNSTRSDSDDMTLTQRRKPPAKPLSEIDRFTMCSNRII